MKASNRRWAAIALALLVATPVLGQPYGVLGRTYLGVYLTDLSEGTRAALGLEKGEGVLVEDIVKDQPADRAGMRAGDVILEFDGHPVGSSGRLTRLLGRAEPGSAVKVIVWRDAKRVGLEVEITERRRPAFFGLDTGPGPQLAPSVPSIGMGIADDGSFAINWSGSSPDRRLGIRVQDLTGQLAEYFEVGRGLLITWVVPDSPAGRAGVQAGDILITLADQPVLGEEDLRFILAGGDLEDEAVPAIVVRRGEKKSLRLEF